MTDAWRDRQGRVVERVRWFPVAASTLDLEPDQFLREVEAWRRTPPPRSLLANRPAVTLDDLIDEALGDRGAR